MDPIRRQALGAAAMIGTAVLPGAAAAQPAPAQRGGGDLSRHQPVELVVTLGAPDGRHVFEPRSIRLRTGVLYKLVLRNVSPDPHYFTSEGLAASVWTRKVQVMGRNASGAPIVLAEIKGAIREVEVYPGQTAEWWLVPVQAGRFDDLRCDIREPNGQTHADHGMRGEVVIE